MKKIFLMGILFLCSFYMSAQITVWQKEVHIKDTVHAALNLFRLSEVDNITFDDNNHMFFWKDNQKLNVRNGFNYNSTDGDNAFLLSMIDSVVWHPYPVKEICAESDSMFFQWNYRKGKKFSLYFNLDPYYTTDEIRLTSSNPDVIELSSELIRHVMPHTWGTGNVNCIVPDNYLKKPGTSIISIYVGRLKKDIVFTVLDPSDEPAYYSTADSLYEAIYNRLTVTGRITPNGHGDIDRMDEGSTGFFRIMHELNELGSDQLCWIWSDYGIKDISHNTWTADNSLLDGLYARLYFNIDLCNQYLNFADTPSDKRAEVRFMRAFYYYYLLDMFGNVPIVKSYPVLTNPEQSTRSEVYQFVEQELLASERELPGMAIDGSHNSIYRADKIAARLLLARLYLNSEVYTGRGEYQKAAQYAKSVIDDDHYGLASQYDVLFKGDNNDDYVGLGNDAAREIIFAAKNNSTDYSSYCGSTYLVSGMNDGSYMPDCGLTSGWQCIRSKKNLVNLFFTDTEAQSVSAANAASVGVDDRAMLCNENKGKRWNLTGPTSDFYSSWGIVKFSNKGASSSFTPSSLQWADMALPLLRKAEAWLTYAEAVLRGANEIDGYTALEAINTIRNRAHAKPFDAIELDMVLDEWGREFFGEGRRRVDLVRFGKFGGQDRYTWEGKSSSDVFDANHNIFPIPAMMIESNPNLVQNPGY